MDPAPSQGTPAIPFLELRTVHETVKGAILAAIDELADTSAFTNGPPVAAFEGAYARYVGTRECVGVASGLDALRLALLAAGLGEGDEAIVPANTFVATFEAISQTGARPVVVDVAEADYNLDVATLEEAITPRTRAVVPVHLYGQMADVGAIAGLCGRHGLALVEDACQAHGAERNGLRAGASGLAAGFSFYPGKNLGAWGDAGAVTTDDAEIARRVRALREHGQEVRHAHDYEGYTARLDSIQALVLLHKLPLLDGWNRERAEAARFYSATLEEVGDVRVPPVPAGSTPVWHVYAIRTARAAELAAFLAERGIATGRHYPQPPHLSRAYERLGHRPGAFPVAEALARELVSLPLFPGIRADQLELVAGAVEDFFSSQATAAPDPGIAAD